MRFLDNESINRKNEIIKNLKNIKNHEERIFLITTLLCTYCDNEEIVTRGLDKDILNKIERNIAKTEIETNEFYCNLKFKKRNELYNIYVSCDNEIYCLKDIHEVVREENCINKFERIGDLRIDHYCKKMDSFDENPKITTCKVGPLFKLELIRSIINEPPKEEFMKEFNIKQTKYKENHFLGQPIYTYNYKRFIENIKKKQKVKI